MKEYSWWGEENDPPPNLKTKKQLAELGLKPVNPVGFIETKKYTLYLYNPDDLTSAKPKRKATEAQQKVLEKGRMTQKRHHWYRYEYGWVECDRAAAVKEARELLEKDFVILDTETTGLYNAEIVEIAICDREGNPVINTLVKPTILIPDEVINIHGITNEMVADAPALPEIWEQIKGAIADKYLVIYNSEFDLGILNYCRKLHKLPKLGLQRDRVECLMELYAQWYGELTYDEDYKWQPLGGGHRALGDCQAALQYLRIIAADNPEIQFPDGIEPGSLM